MDRRVATYRVGAEIIEIWCHKANDFSVYFFNADCSVRGTLLDVMREIDNAFGIEALVEVV